jgi:hypothetical protein
MVLLGDEAQVEGRFSPFGDSGNLVQDRCTVCTERSRGILFWTHRMELLGNLGHVESRFGLFGDSVSVSAR